jgi:phospholipid/cholesterol/gamma-HCH transport system substrate-binding protein
MSPYRRNFLVGTVVFVALCVLAWMIVRFGGSLGQPFAPANMPVVFVTDRADGLADGSPVLYRGVIVGKVATVRRNDDNLGVRIDAMLDDKPPLPENVRGSIRTQSFLGAAGAVSLELTGPKPEGQLRPNAEIPTGFVGLDVLPPEYSQLATELRLAVTQFRESGIVANVNSQVTKVGELMDSIRELTSDEKLRADLRASLENIRLASEDAARVAAKFNDLSTKLNKITDEAGGAVTDARATINMTQGHIDDLARQVSGRLEQLAKTLEHFRSISAKIDQGDGTAGLLVNDPKLYQALVDSSQKLSVTVSDLSRLIQQWEQEGLSLKMR